MRERFHFMDTGLLLPKAISGMRLCKEVPCHTVPGALGELILAGSDDVTSSGGI